MNFIKNNPGKIKAIIIFIIFSIFIVWQSTSWHSNDILVDGYKRIRIYDFVPSDNALEFKVINRTHREIRIKTVSFQGEENKFVDRQYTYVPAGHKGKVHIAYRMWMPHYTGETHLNVEVTSNDLDKESEKYGNFSITFDVEDDQIRSYTTGEPVEVSEPTPEGSYFDFTIPHGELISVQTSGDTLTLKAEITALYSNKNTVNQNYFNVESIIENGGDQYSKIQYSAVFKSEGGEEVKVISFTLTSDTIELIKNGSIAATQIGDYAYDLYVLPSLM